MTILTERELAQLRSDLNDLLSDTCRIERATPTNTNGNTSESWGTVSTSVACRIDPEGNPTPGVISEREAGMVHYRLTLPYNADIADGDRVVIGSDTYYLLELHEGHSERAVRRGRVGKVRT